VPVNLGSRRAVQREHAAQIRIMMAHEKPFTSRLKIALDVSWFDVARLIRQGVSHEPAMEAIDSHEKRLSRITGAYTTVAARVFGERFFDRLGKSAHFRVETKNHDFEHSITLWLRRYGATEVRYISAGSKKAIRRLLVKSVTDGWTVEQTAKAIREKAKRINRTRAHFIARTEIHTASMKALDTAAEVSGLPMIDTWVATRGPRTRQTHRIADKQKVPHGASFTVGGYKAKHPGDPALPLKERAGCRCVKTYETGELENEGPRDTSLEPAQKLPAAELEALSIAQREAQRYLREKGSATGVEHLLMIDRANGVRIDATTDNDVRSVSLTNKMYQATRFKGRNIEAHHNHPSSSSLSLADLGLTDSLPSLSRVWAHAHDGGWYHGHAVDGTALREYWVRLFRGSGSVLQTAYRGGLTAENDLSSFAAHITNLALSKAGIIQYEFKLSARQLEIWRKNAHILDEAVNAAVAVIEEN